LSVSHANGKPVLVYPGVSDGLPSGLTPVQFDGEQYEADFATGAIRVVHLPGETANELPSLLRGWFGADAGLPGTNHHVSLVHRGGEWVVERQVAASQRLELWRSYSREQIPGLFGEQFSEAVWNVGFVVRPTDAPKRMVLLVTIEKKDLHGDFAYRDVFLAPDQLQWQSQNRTRRTDKHGKLIHDHEKLGVEVHLFVRAQKKDAKGAAAPFVYCGQARFESWEGEKPITVKWRLEHLLPDRLFMQFRKP
jgi:hypothetical protein